MKMLYLIFSIMFLSISNAAYSQKEINDIGEYINNKCENCSQKDLNIFIMKLCKQSDSILNSCVKRFDLKLINEKYLRQDFKKIIKVDYHNSLADLVALRKKTMTRFARMNPPSTVNDYNRGILYLYMNQTIISVLAFIEINTFGDFYIAPPVWDKSEK